MIYFFNANMELKKVVNSENVVSAVHEHELNGVILSAIELDLSYARAFKDGVEYFGYYYENNFYIHKIRRVEEEHGSETLLFIGRHIFFDELMTGELVQDVRPVERDAVYTANATIGNTTRWKPFGNNTTKHLSSNFYWELPMEVLNTIVEQFQVEYLPIIEFDGKEITGTKLRIDERIGKDSGIRIPYGSRVLSLKYDIDYEQIITKLFVQGRGEEVGDGYGRRINIKDVNFSKDGVISPAGVFYLYDQSLIDEYGVRHGKEIFEDIEDVNELAQAGYDYYIENSRPKMLFTAEVAQIGNVSIGDTVNIIRREYDVYFKARIHKITVNLLNKSDASVELGDYEHFKESKVDRIERKNNEIKQQQTNNRIESLKRQFDTEFDAQVEEFRKEFEQKLIDVSAEIVADQERMENEMSQMKLDQQQRVEEIMTTIGEHDIHLQSIDENGLLKSDFILKPDGFMLGNISYDGSNMAQAIVGKAGAIDLIADNVNLSNNLNVANQIKSLSLETVYANISELRTRMLVADVITADMVKFDTAMIEKFTSSTAFINSLTSKQAFINTAKVTELISADGRDSFTLAGGMMNWTRSTGQTMQLGIDGIYMKNSDGSTRFQMDRGMVTSAALGTSNSNVYLATDTGFEARVIDRNELPGGGAVEDYTYRPIRALVYRFPNIPNAYFSLLNGGEFRFTGEQTGTGRVYQPLRASGYYGDFFDGNSQTAGTNLYIRPASDAEVRFTQSGTTTNYVDIRAKVMYATAFTTNSTHAYIGSDGELRVVNKGISGIYRDVRAAGYYGTFIETTATNIYVRASGEVRFTANGTTGTYIPIRFKEWTATSHERYKREIADWNYSVLDIFKNDLKLKRFKFTDETGSIYDRFRHGIVIRTDSNLDEFPVEWRNGDGFDGNEVMWWTVKGVQELAHENDSLKDRIIDLENKLNKIMEMIA